MEELEIEEEKIVDTTQDFMSSETKDWYIPFTISAIGPWLANALLQLYFLQTNEGYKLSSNFKPTSDKS